MVHAMALDIMREGCLERWIETANVECSRAAITTEQLTTISTAISKGMTSWTAWHA